MSLDTLKVTTIGAAGTGGMELIHQVPTSGDPVEAKLKMAMQIITFLITAGTIIADRIEKRRTKRRDRREEKRNEK